MTGAKSSEENWQGERMREAADAARLSSDEIGNRIKKSGATVRRWWDGTRNISLDDLKAYAIITNSTLDYFLYKEHRLPENAHIRQKIDRMATELEQLRKSIEAPRGFKTVNATDGTPVCIPADRDIDQETIDAMAELQTYGLPAVSENNVA